VIERTLIDRGRARQIQALAASDPEFRAWLRNDYRPLAGGWQY
jgi:hypothetical protein